MRNATVALLVVLAACGAGGPGDAQSATTASEAQVSEAPATEPTVGDESAATPIEPTTTTTTTTTTQPVEPTPLADLDSLVEAFSAARSATTVEQVIEDLLFFVPEGDFDLVPVGRVVDLRIELSDHTRDPGDGSPYMSRQGVDYEWAGMTRDQAVAAVAAATFDGFELTDHSQGEDGQPNVDYFEFTSGEGPKPGVPLERITLSVTDMTIGVRFTHFFLTDDERAAYIETYGAWRSEVFEWPDMPLHEFDVSYDNRDPSIPGYMYFTTDQWERVDPSLATTEALEPQAEELMAFFEEDGWQITDAWFENPDQPEPTDLWYLTLAPRDKWLNAAATQTSLPEVGDVRLLFKGWLSLD